MTQKEYEVIHSVNLSGEKSVRGDVIEVEDKEAAPLVMSGVLRPLPQKKKKAATENVEESPPRRGRPPKSRVPEESDE